MTSTPRQDFADELEAAGYPALAGMAATGRTLDEICDYARQLPATDQLHAVLQREHGRQRHGRRADEPVTVVPATADQDRRTIPPAPEVERIVADDVHVGDFIGRTRAELARRVDRNVTVAAVSRGPKAIRIEFDPTRSTIRPNRTAKLWRAVTGEGC